MRVLGLTRTGAAPRQPATRFDTGRALADRRRRPSSSPMDRLDDVLAQSDFLVVVVPLTEQTRGMIGARELDLLPAGASS